MWYHSYVSSSFLDFLYVHTFKQNFPEFNMFSYNIKVVNKQEALKLLMLGLVIVFRV